MLELVRPERARVGPAVEEHHWRLAGVAELQSRHGARVVSHLYSTLLHELNLGRDKKKLSNQRRLIICLATRKMLETAENVAPSSPIPKRHNDMQYIVLPIFHHER